MHMTTYTTKPSPMHSGHDIRDASGHMIAIVHNPAANSVEGARIAALMAAAPELLAALIELQQWAEYNGIPEGTGEIALAAIARATRAP